MPEVQTKLETFVQVWYHLAAAVSQFPVDRRAAAVGRVLSVLGCMGTQSHGAPTSIVLACMFPPAVDRRRYTSEDGLGVRATTSAYKVPERPLFVVHDARWESI